MNSRLLSLSMSILLGTVLISCSANKSENTDDTVSTKIDKQNLTANSKQICPAIDSFENTKTIDMKDMMFTYFKYEGHICGTLEVKLDANKDCPLKAVVGLQQALELKL
jgi:hypothetical protein